MKTWTLGWLVAGCVCWAGVNTGVAGPDDGRLGGGSSDGKLEARPLEKPALFNPQIAELYQQAVILFRQRRFDEAEVNCRRILTIKTNELNAVQMLRDIADRRLREPSTDSRAALKQTLSQMILPEFKAVDAVARDAVAFLQQQSALVTPDKTPVNLVWNVPAGDKVPMVTLSLYRVSLADVLKYLTEANGLACRYDDYAVVIAKPGPPGAETIGRVADELGTIVSDTPLKRRLKEIVLPKFEVANLPARDAIHRLQDLAAKAGSDRTPINIVWTVPADQAVPNVTLALYKIPLADALRYVTELSGLGYRVDERAVVICPVETAPTVTTGAK